MSIALSCGHSVDIALRVGEYGPCECGSRVTVSGQRGEWTITNASTAPDCKVTVYFPAARERG